MTLNLRQENYDRRDQYATGVFFGGDAVDSCQTAIETQVFDKNPVGTPDTRNNLQLSMNNIWSDPNNDDRI